MNVQVATGVGDVYIYPQIWWHGFDGCTVFEHCGSLLVCLQMAHFAYFIIVKYSFQLINCK